MPQMFIPLFSEGLSHINSGLAYQKKDARIYYFNGHQMPVFSHNEKDIPSFRMIMSQFYVNGHATQSEIVKAFGLPPITLKRAVKTFRMHGPSGFYPRTLKPQRKPRVLTDQVISEVQKRLDEGIKTKEIALELKLKEDTLQKAIRDGRLKKKSAHMK
jgi:hypothetical protein